MKKINSLVLISLLVFLPINVSIAAEMFLKIDGIDGESTDTDHEDEIDVHSWSWGVVHPTSVNRGGKGRITLSKAVDTSSPKILESCSNGTHYNEAVLTVRKADGSRIEYVKIVLQDLVITRVVTKSPKEGEDRLTEDFTLNFEEIKSSYTRQNADGSSGGNVETTWKIEEGE